MRILKSKMPMLATVLAIVLAIGTSAFTPKQSSKNLDELYFVLTVQSDENSYISRTDPTKWELANTDGSNVSCDFGSVHICKIKAVNNDGEPVIGGMGDPLFDLLENGQDDDLPANEGTIYVTKAEDN